jgi:hypothetical protein
VQELERLILEFGNEKSLCEEPQQYEISSLTIRVANILCINPIDEHLKHKGVYSLKIKGLAASLLEVPIECGIEVRRIVADEIFMDDKDLAFAFLF